MDWKTRGGQRTKAASASGLRGASYSRSLVYTNARGGGVDRDSGIARSGQRDIGIVSILVIKDRTQGTGRFNVAASSLATMVGIGAAASTTFGGVLIQRLGVSSVVSGAGRDCVARLCVVMVRRA